MYPVTQDFVDKMRADRRQVFAKCEIDYTDPFLDQSIEIAANEQANVSYPQQTADSVDAATYKWASLDGSWVLDGSYHLAPDGGQLAQYQFGWWGSQLAGTGGAFASPYPALTVTHLPRPIHTLKVIGDTVRGEYPVDFEIKLYAQDNTLLYTKNVIGNTQVSWQFALASPVLDVAKQALVITKWSHEGRQAKIIEFFTSIRETYETGDLVSLRLLEEREASQGSLPVGNISANEVSLVLNNKDKKFDIDNEYSPLKNLLKPNRRIQLWLGIDAENNYSSNPPTFARSSVAYKSDGTQVAVNQPRFEAGKFGQAVMVEEGTTNVFPWSKSFEDCSGEHVGDPNNPNSVITSWGGGWYGSTHYNSATIKISEDGGLYGSKRLSFIHDGSVGWKGASTEPWSIISGRTYTVTVWARANQTSAAGFSAGFAFYQYGGQIYFFTWPDGYPTQQPGKWVRGIRTFTATADAVGRTYLYGLSAGESGLIVDYDGIQVEEKSYATSYTDSARSSETLTIPTAGVLDSQGGTVEFWWNPQQPSSGIISQSTSPKLLQLGSYYANASLTLWAYHQPGAEPALILLVKGQSNSGWSLAAGVKSSGSGWYRPGEFHHFAITWVNGNNFKVYMDGVLAGGPYTISDPITSWAGGIAYLPGDGGGTDSRGTTNSLIDDLRISSRARTDEEIAAGYASGQPLPVDEWTTYKLTFDGSIYPVERVWIPLGTFWSLDWDSPDDTLEATVTARDRLELLRKGTYQSSQVQTNVSLYTLAEQVLQDAGLTTSEYIIDTTLQSIIIPYTWFNPVSHREALRIIAEAALAAVYAGRDGKIRIESFASTGTTTDLEITEDDYFTLRAPSKQGEVANEIIVTTQPLRPAEVAEEVYRSNEPITIPASSTKTVMTYYNSPPVIEAAASLDSPPSGVSITGVLYYGWGASVTIQNTNSIDQQVTLVIQGKPLTVQNKERAIARDEISIVENGVLRYEFPENPLVQTLTQAQSIADTLLASVKNPRRDIEIDWRGNPALLLGDQVRIKGKDYHIIRQEIEWDGALGARLTGRKVS